MTTIITRTAKGSRLTWAEADANLTNLNNDKLETSAVGVSVQPYSANLTEFATVNPTAAGLALLDDADAAAQRTTLGAVGSTELAASSGSSLVGFLQAGTGAVSRTLQAKARDIVNVKDFGAVGNGVTDDTTAISLAINAANYGEVFFPEGQYLYSSLTLSKGCTIKGSGKHSTVLKCSSTTGNSITLTDTYPYVFSDMSFTCSGTKTSGATIIVSPASSYNADSVFTRCAFPSTYEAIRFSSAATWTIDDCNFEGHTSSAVVVGNSNTPDAGDSTIKNCVFNTSTTTAVHINQTSSGGLRICNNKFLAAGYHYLGAFSTYPNNTSILVFTGNSSESATTANIAFTSSSSTTFANVVIVGNQFSVKDSGRGILVVDPGYDYLSGLLIANNTFNQASNSYGIVLNRGTNVSIGNNEYSGNGTSIIGVYVASASIVGTIAPQHMYNITTEYSGTFTNITFNPPRIEGGSVSATTSTVNGALYISSSGNITFSKAFPKAPKVMGNALDTGGGVSIVFGNPTTTGVTYRLLGVTNGGNAQATWIAMG